MASGWAANAIRAGLALVLPLVLAFTAIPLESFLASLRTVTGVCGVFLLRVLSLALRVVGAVVLRTGAFLVRLYDIVIFLPLWLEQKWVTRHREAAAGASESAESGG